MNTLTFIWDHSSSRVLELLPWFMLAVVLGRLLQSMRLEVLTAGGLRRRNATAIVGTTLFGSLTPFCACAIVPIIRSVLRSGVPLSVVMSFWIASPAMAPEEFGLTAKVFGIKMAIVRLLAAIALGIGAALVARFLEYRGWLTQTSKEPVTERQQARLVGAAVPAGQAGTCCTTETCSTAAGPAAPRPLALADDLAPARTRVLPLEPAAGGVTACATAVLAEPSTPAAAGCGYDACGAAGTNGCAGTQDAGGAGAPAVSPGWLSLAKQSLREIRPVSFARHVASDSWTLGRWMLLGILIEALVTRFVRPSAFGGLLGGHNLLLSVLAAGLLSIPLYLNGVSALPHRRSPDEHGPEPGGPDHLPAGRLDHYLPGHGRCPRSGLQPCVRALCDDRRDRADDYRPAGRTPDQLNRCNGAGPGASRTSAVRPWPGTRAAAVHQCRTTDLAPAGLVAA